MTSQKRRYDRIDSLRLLSYSCVDHENKVVSRGMGRTLNVSEGGILIETHVPLEKACTVLLAIGFEDDVTEVRGRIVHGKRGENGRERTGIEFIDPDEKARRIIRRYVKAFFNTPDEAGKPE
ncbi:MAG: PilZ domain-containing protein [Thermodesulfobacteriota bacterium]|nr:PilZ domain-containing protein [Thermodesulfobacteriota bacterium]